MFVIREGLEPSAYCLEGSCSIQLSYRTKPFYYFRLQNYGKWIEKPNLLAFFCLSAKLVPQISF